MDELATAYGQKWFQDAEGNDVVKIILKENREIPWVHPKGWFKGIFLLEKSYMSLSLMVKYFVGVHFTKKATKNKGSETNIARLQERVRKCARDSGYERSVFLMRLKDVAFEVQKPVLEKWGFEGNEHGVREMTAAIREHAGKNGKDMPEWLKEKQDRCLELLYGGKEGGMLDILR